MFQLGGIYDPKTGPLAFRIEPRFEELYCRESHLFLLLCELMTHQSTPLCCVLLPLHALPIPQGLDLAPRVGYAMGDKLRTSRCLCATPFCKCRFQPLQGHCYLFFLKNMSLFSEVLSAFDSLLLGCCIFFQAYCQYLYEYLSQVRPIKVGLNQIKRVYHDNVKR
ncbi:hypothetical protein Nepgr_001132 [Nepenthes gracilis]|uniref:Uncharacterized protein n=1 Tax=Nepenthes gracilis TaxID=150966 RepID=A0AAD3P4N1_NEPGR|nr:hypothetical protein Nepgr_001132 [Nepenthes gracilis]